MTDAHPLELAFLLVAVVALVQAIGLFALKLSDVVRVKRSKQNGPMLFATVDNLRRQGFTLAVCGGMLMLAVSSANNTVPLTSQSLNLLMGGVFFALALIIEGAFIYRRREKMAVLIALYEGVPGGRRESDPPQG